MKQIVLINRDETSRMKLKRCKIQDVAYQDEKLRMQQIGATTSRRRPPAATGKQFFQKFVFQFYPTRNAILLVSFPEFLFTISKMKLHYNYYYYYYQLTIIYYYNYYTIWAILTENRKTREIENYLQDLAHQMLNLLNQVSFYSYQYDFEIFQSCRNFCSNNYLRA